MAEGQKSGGGGVTESSLKGKDGAQYFRQQQGHSIVKCILFGWTTLYILPIYWACSKNHYFHA